jgi:hypothetical protein
MPQFVFSPNIAVLWNIYICIYGGPEIVYGYGYNQMMLQVKIFFLYKPETVTS